VTVGFIVPGPGGDGTWVDGALAARRLLADEGFATEVITGMPAAIPADWSVAVCHGGQYAGLAASPALGPASLSSRVVIVSDAHVLPPGISGVTEIDWGWPDAFFCAGFAARELAGDGRAVVFVAGAAVPTQRSLVDAFLTGLLESGGRPLPVHVTYLPSFDDVATAREVVKDALGTGRPALYVSSSDGAGAAALEVARAAGAPTVSFLREPGEGETGAVVCDIPGTLAGLVRRAAGGEPLPPLVTLTLGSGQVGLRLGGGASDAARVSAARAARLLDGRAG
jgi:hypothetical protein